MKDILVAQRYSKAIISDLKENEINSILADIELMSNSLQQEPELVNAVNSYLFPQNKRMEIAMEMTQKLANTKLWENLFSILIKKHRFNIIQVILKDLENKIFTMRNQIKVKLVVAHELPEKVLNSISDKLKKILEKDILLDIYIEPGILGGFVATTDSLLIDGSIKNNLVKLLKVKSKKKK
ncbi:MAG: ATP synthase F1 subunit delta [Candidatus Cloacimonetes bacterium]|nr:ATP synthase F1 subunit delta [Candidatus Cloacimonadota bacterium]MBT5419268.1 ATP synthase F1 subunit delta [Candidatus Cloacimonadota bacterium]